MAFASYDFLNKDINSIIAVFLCCIPKWIKINKPSAGLQALYCTLGVACCVYAKRDTNLIRQLGEESCYY